MKYSLITEADDDGKIIRFAFEIIHPDNVEIPNDNLEMVQAAIRSASLAASQEFKRAMTS